MNASFLDRLKTMLGIKNSLEIDRKIEEIQSKSEEVKSHLEELSNKPDPFRALVVTLREEYFRRVKHDGPMGNPG